MSVKKQIPSFSKLFSNSREIRAEFLDGTDVDSSFHHNSFEFSQSQHQKVRVAKGSNKKTFAIKLFLFAI